MNTETEPRIVAIHGAPRSGTSWLGELFNSNEHVAYRYQPFFSYAFRGRIDIDSGAADLQAFFSDLLATQDDFVLQTSAARLSSETFQFRKGDITHLVYKEVRFHHLLPRLMTTVPEMKAIGIVRDPRAVLASWSNAPREFDSAWSLASEWRDARSKNAGREENWYGFERWKQLASCFLNLSTKFPQRFHLVRYEELLADPIGKTTALFHFCGLQVTAQTRAFIAASTSRNDGDVYGVHRDHSALTAAMTRREDSITTQIHDELRNTPLARFLVG